MSAQVLCFVLGVILALAGVVLLLVGSISLDPYWSERSRFDDRYLGEKALSGSWKEYQAARLEGSRRMLEKWRASPRSRRLVYSGAILMLTALFCFWLAGPL